MIFTYITEKYFYRVLFLGAEIQWILLKLLFISGSILADEHETVDANDSLVTKRGRKGTRIISLHNHFDGTFEKSQREMAIALNWYIFDPILVKPKCT